MFSIEFRVLPKRGPLDARQVAHEQENQT